MCWKQDLLLVATRSAVFVLAVFRLGKRSRSFLANVEHIQDVCTKYRVVRRGYDISGMVLTSLSNIYIRGSMSASGQGM